MTPEERRDTTDEQTQQIDLTLAQERLVTGTETVETGSVRARAASGWRSRPRATSA